ncbi:MAG: hypothetical protein OXF74_12315 [Rhodobacteraceae bacterium]|nr:hypothetical protein [Paracoccaceae bacterium]
MRPPDLVMRLERMGASHATRLSFMRQLIRRLHADGSVVERNLWQICAQGYGRAVYSLLLGGHRYSLCAFSRALDAADRTDRVIANAWDATFVLYDGVPGKSELERIEANATRQEAGRYSPKELVLSRANRSIRIFGHVVDRLAAGKQPDAGLVVRTGYLMRTTAVYGNGKFGLADRDRIASRPALSAPFQAEMLTVWLIRGFTHDLVQHIAACRQPDQFQPLCRKIRRHLGIGNATGLGMAPFLVSHPVLFNNWMRARETALARICALERTDDATVAAFMAVLNRARAHFAELEIEDALQSHKNQLLRRELSEFEPTLLGRPHPWRQLINESKCRSLEFQELLVAIAIEPHASLVDDLCAEMASPVNAEIRPGSEISDLRRLYERHFGWVGEFDMTCPDASRMFWYVSEEKLEPRLGDAQRDPGIERALPLDTARQLAELGGELFQCSDRTVAEFLIRRPGLRHAVRRLQTAESCTYSEIRANLTGFGIRPIDMLRSKLAFFGAERFDPKSDLWTRITMYSGAPDFSSIGAGDADDWAFASLYP